MAGNKCDEHWYTQQAVNNTGNRADGPMLRRILERQGFRCRYTGEVLTPGVNANVDHVVPRSRGGTNDESNLQWVTARINRMKTDMTHEEFLAACVEVAKYA